MKKIIVTILAVCLAVLLAACGGTNTNQGTETSSGSSGSAVPASTGIDYMVLVNKTHPLPADWEDKLQTVHFTNSVGDDVEVEVKAYDAYLKLKADLEKEGIYVDLDSARRSVADQQRIMDEFTQQYGADYAKKTVAQPGYSEHHTGLALDLYLIIDGVDVVENEDMIQYPEIWDKINEKLAENGFILRYLDGKEHITGYGYEPWHIRYIDDPTAAAEIMSQPGMTLEVWLNAAEDTDAAIDYGTSNLYSEDLLKEAAIQVKCNFAYNDKCKLYALKYAGDEVSNEENLNLVKTLTGNNDYTQVIEFLCDLHSAPDASVNDWEPDHEYKDYPCWLARKGDSGFEVVKWGELK